MGWCLRGESSSNRKSVCLAVKDVPNDDLEAKLEKFWSTDSFGSHRVTDVPQSEEDRRATRMLESGTRQMSKGNYESGMLWKSDTVVLPNNRSQAYKRFISQRRRLAANPVTHRLYCEGMRGDLSKGYSRRTLPSEPSTPKDNWLPHREVINPNKDKLRIVKDASARCKGTSLNANLLKGPEMTSSQTGVLLRFRISKVVLSADVAEMFKRVHVPVEDQNSLRFLWTESLTDEPDEYKMTVHIFGATCSPCCANFALRKTAYDHPEYSEEARRTVLRSFYVDDLLRSCRDESTAVSLAHELIKLLATGGFNLTKWVSNSRAVLDAMSAEPNVTTEINLDLDEDLISRALGVRWNVRKDTIVFSTISPEPAFTKRQILSVVCSVYDPLGFLTPYILRAKLILQSLWADGVPWDVAIRDEILKLWENWTSKLADLGQFELDRKYWPTELDERGNVECALHFFADASERAFAAVAYIRAVSESGRIHCSFVTSKSRVAPISSKCLTLPRLELEAAVLAVRLYHTLKRELDVEFQKVYFWTDSEIVRSYLNNDSKRFLPFVANRIAEIRHMSKPSDWNHCPGQWNPADDGTRGLSVVALSSPDSRWLHGPDFLWHDESRWPKTGAAESISESDPEIKVRLVAATVKRICGGIPIHPILNHDEISSLSKLLRITAWIKRFVHNLQTKKDQRTKGTLKVSEIKVAHDYWIKVAQIEGYPSEIESIRTRGIVPARSHLIKLRPIIDDDILRVGGRIDRAQISYDARHQILLPTDHHITKLIIYDAHVKTAHGGTASTMAYLRQRYWIPKVKSRIKRCINDCTICRKLKSNPKIPMMSELPEARLGLDQPCWSYTGCDYFGFMLVKCGRQRLKRWGALFTDLTTRAIHLEIVNSLEADAFLLAFRRFLARRGPISHLYSDRGTSFTGSVTELRAAIKQLAECEEVGGFLTSRGIQWHFIPPKAPHMGGAWERLVKSTKIALKAILKDRIVSEDVLHTTLVEIERLVNSRPLSENPDSPDELEALSPNHFILHHNRQLPVFCDADPSCLNSRKRWKQSQWLVQHFWQRFRREYLPSLCISHKWNSEQPNLKVGDIVVIVDHSAPRGYWPLGRVLDLDLGRDNRVRAVTLRTKNGSLVRPASQVCLVESPGA